jgi:hypothetical protein
LGFTDIVLNLDASFDGFVDLYILQGLDELLDLPAGFGGMLKVEAFNDVCHITEPACIVFVYVSLAPVTVAREVFSDFVHVFEGLLFVFSPYLSLGIHQIRKDAFQLMLEFRKMQQQGDNVFHSCVLVGLVSFNDLLVLLVFAVFMKHEPSDGHI